MLTGLTRNVEHVRLAGDASFDDDVLYVGKEFGDIVVLFAKVLLQCSKGPFGTFTIIV